MCSDDKEYVLLTVLWDPDSLCSVLLDTWQRNNWVKDMGDLAIIQQVIHHLDLLPAWTQQHCYGLDTNPPNRESTEPKVRTPSVCQ